MTFLRGLAENILNGVIRFAPVATKYWAKAMLGEMGSISNDWSALFWAMGGIRLLFQGGEIPLASLADVPRAAERLKKKIDRRTLGGFATTLFESVAFARFAFVLHNPMQRAGAFLVVVAMAYMGFQVFARRVEKMPGEIDLSTYADLYRVELNRQREFHCGWWFWSRGAVVLPGLLLFLSGNAAAHPDRIHQISMTGVCFVVLLIVAVLRNLQLSKKFAYKIAELDAVRAESR